MNSFHLLLTTSVSSNRSSRHLFVGALLIGGMTILGNSAHANDWLGFRGSTTTAASDDLTSVPSDDGLNVAWEVPTAARGISSPILVGGQVIVTSSGGQDERDLYVESFDAGDGHRSWKRTFHALGRPYTHPTSANASPSPASDGEYVVALFSSCDLVCLRADGTPVWVRAIAVDHPQTGNDVSMSSSPAIADGVVAVQLENQGDSFASGIDLATGVTLWTHPRPNRSGWASPVAVKLPRSGEERNQPAFAFQNADGVEMLNAKTGELICNLEVSASITTSPTWASPLLIVPGDGLTAFDLSSPTAPIVWENSRLGCKNASPVVRGDRIYANRGSMLAAGNLTDGEIVWQQRLRDIKSVWATPIATASGVYVVDQSGAIMVVEDSQLNASPASDSKDDKSDEAEVLGSAEFTGPMLATPAVSQGNLFLRSNESLIKIAAP